MRTEPLSSATFIGFQDGQKWALKEIYESFSPLLFLVFSQVFIADTPNQLDIITDGFAHAYKNRNKYSSLEEVKASIFSKFKDNCISHLNLNPAAKHPLFNLEEPMAFGNALIKAMLNV